MAQTLRDVATELELFEYSTQYLDLMREEAEIELVDNYLEAQQNLLSMTVRPYLTEGYLLEDATPEQVEEIKQKNEKRKSSFKGKLVAVLLKAYQFVVKFLRRINEAWTKLFSKRKETIRSLAKQENPFDAEMSQKFIENCENKCKSMEVYPFKEQPFGKMVQKAVKFSNNVSQEMQLQVIRYLAFGLGDIIILKSNGDEIQMDVGTRLMRQQGMANDSVDSLANEKVLEDLKARANKEGIRVELTGDHFKDTLEYYEKMVQKYQEIGNKYTVDQNTKELAADMNGNEKAKENAQKKADQMTARSSTCAALSAALSKTCTLIDRAHKFQLWLLETVAGPKGSIFQGDRPISIPEEEEAPSEKKADPDEAHPKDMQSRLEHIARAELEQMRGDPNWKPVETSDRGTAPKKGYAANKSKQYGLKNPDYTTEQRRWIYNSWCQAYNYYLTTPGPKTASDWYRCITVDLAKKESFARLLLHTTNAFGQMFNTNNIGKGPVVWMQALKAYLTAYEKMEGGEQA